MLEIDEKLIALIAIVYLLFFYKKQNFRHVYCSWNQHVSIVISQRRFFQTGIGIRIWEFIGANRIMFSYKVCDCPHEEIEDNIIKIEEALQSETPLISLQRFFPEFLNVDVVEKFHINAYERNKVQKGDWLKADRGLFYHDGVSLGDTVVHLVNVDPEENLRQNNLYPEETYQARNSGWGWRISGSSSSSGGSSRMSGYGSISGISGSSTPSGISRTSTGSTLSTSRGISNGLGFTGDSAIMVDCFEDFIQDSISLEINRMIIPTVTEATLRSNIENEIRNLGSYNAITNNCQHFVTRIFGLPSSSHSVQNVTRSIFFILRELSRS